MARPLIYAERRVKPGAKPFAAPGHGSSKHAGENLAELEFGGASVPTTSSPVPSVDSRNSLKLRADCVAASDASTGSGYWVQREEASMKQRELRQRIDIAPRMGQVSPVAYWYKHDHFENEDQARGAFELAYQQGLDGMGSSIASWMGLTKEEFDAWMRDGTLPPKS